MAKLKRIHWILAGLALLVLLAGAAAAFALWSLTHLGTHLERSDFDTSLQARDFVAGHLPERLPKGAEVTSLLYDRWTDWHLEATLTFESPAAASDYLTRLKSVATTNDAYCGPAEPPGSVPYFLPHFYACGNLRPEADPRKLKLRVFTR